jgi:hypothetical protein
MPRHNRRITDTELQRQVERRIQHIEYADRLADGWVPRSQTFKPSRGKGSYTRRTKHRPDYIAA